MGLTCQDVGAPQSCPDGQQCIPRAADGTAAHCGPPEVLSPPSVSCTGRELPFAGELCGPAGHACSVIATEDVTAPGRATTPVIALANGEPSVMYEDLERGQFAHRV